jgi:hypothetical protein
LNQQALTEFHYRAMRQAQGGSPAGEVAERMSIPRVPWRSTKLSSGPDSVRRMTKHDQRRESDTHGVEERLEWGLRRTSPEANNRVATALGCETVMLLEQRRIV